MGLRRLNGIVVFSDPIWSLDRLSTRGQIGPQGVVILNVALAFVMEDPIASEANFRDFLYVRGTHDLVPLVLIVLPLLSWFAEVNLD